MLIKYNGEYAQEVRTYSGCSRCGTGRSVNGKVVYKTQYRTYYEGRLIIFQQDKPVEVDDMLGNFLLKKTYRDANGKVKPSFSEAEESGLLHESEMDNEEVIYYEIEIEDEQ